MIFPSFTVFLALEGVVYNELAKPKQKPYLFDTKKCKRCKGELDKYEVSNKKYLICGVCGWWIEDNGRNHS